MKWLVILPALLFIAACDNKPIANADSTPCRIGDEICGGGLYFKYVCSENGWEYLQNNCTAPEYCYGYYDQINEQYRTICSQERPTDPVCKEGDSFCLFGSYVTCPNGNALLYSSCSGDGTEECVSSFKNNVYYAECAPRICTEGETVCRSNEQIYICDKNSEWIFGRSCSASANEICIQEVSDDGKWHAHCEGRDLKPNIYLYPTAPLDITVKIGFPQGGRVTASEPLYDDGWTVHVTPDGMIDDQWRFLFYESLLPNGWQRERGYLVATDEMERFFRDDLLARGFVGQEIEDFIDWWIPRLAAPGYLIVYPQDDAVIRTLETLELSVTPDSLLRHRYLIETTAEPVTIEPPDAPAPFARNGFTVTEWGVIRI